MFYTNQRDGPITDKQEIVVYHNGDDLIKKLDFLLEHDELREKIAKNGQKAVLAKHKFTDRLKEMLEVIKNGSNAMWTQHIMDDKNIRQRN